MPFWFNETASTYADSTWDDGPIMTWTNSTVSSTGGIAFRVVVFPTTRFEEAGPPYHEVRDVAIRKAEALLREHLDPEQQDQLNRNNQFRLIARSGRCYEISRGHAGNIFAFGGAQTMKYCIHTRESMPDADHMLAQKLLLESNEEEFLRLANVTPLAA